MMKPIRLADKANNRNNPDHGAISLVGYTQAERNAIEALDFLTSSMSRAAYGQQQSAQRIVVTDKFISKLIVLILGVETPERDDLIYRLQL